MMECSVASTTYVGRPIVTGYIYEVKCAKAIEQIPNDSSASVYKADAFDPAKPEYRVRYWDKEGNYTDTNVQINGVNPRNASYLEMLAYTTYSDVEGFTKNAFGDFMNVARGVNGNISYDADNIKEKKDYMSMVKELMQLQYDSNNLPGYLSYKELYDYMNDKING